MVARREPVPALRREPWQVDQLESLRGAWRIIQRESLRGHWRIIRREPGRICRSAARRKPGFRQESMPATGSFEAGKMKNKRSKTAEEANEEFRRAFEIISFGRAEIPISEIAEYLGLAEKTMYTRAKRLGKEFKVKKGMVRMVEMQENQGSEGSSGEP